MREPGVRGEPSTSDVLFLTLRYIPLFWAFSPKYFWNSIQKKGIIYLVWLRGNGSHIFPIEELFKLFFAFRSLVQLMTPADQAVQLPIPIL